MQHKAKNKKITFHDTNVMVMGVNEAAGTCICSKEKPTNITINNNN